jgi:hypothetical protein
MTKLYCDVGTTSLVSLCSGCRSVVWAEAETTYIGTIFYTTPTDRSRSPVTLGQSGDSTVEMMTPILFREARRMHAARPTTYY